MKRPITLALSLLLGLSLLVAGATVLAAAPAEGFSYYKIRFLGAEGAGSGVPDELPSLNDGGTVVGNFRTNGGAIRPWVQQPGGARQYLPLPPGIQNGEAADINGNGVIIGSLWNNPASKRLARWTPGMDGYTVNALCNNEVIEGVALNDSGVAIGHRTMTRVEDGRVEQMVDGVRFIPGVGCQPLTPYGFTALPADINDEGDIVGGQFLLRGTNNFNIGMPPTFTDGSFAAINNLGHIVGTAEDGDQNRIQFVNYELANWALFGEPSPGASGIDLNDLGGGIGIGTLGVEPDEPTKSCCWCLTCTVALAPEAVYLDTLLLPAIQGLDLSGLSDLNNADQIVGRASGPIFPGGWETFLLTPVEACASGCVRSQNIYMTPYFAGGNRYAIGLVFARNENNQAVPNAKVYASWQRPDGTLLHRTATTNAQGRALFFTPAPVDGTYRLYVTDMERPPLAYDPLDSNTLSAELTVP